MHFSHLCNVHCLVQRMSATGPSRSQPPWKYFLNPEHTSPAVQATEINIWVHSCDLIVMWISQWRLSGTDRFPRKRFKLAINDGHLGILKLTLECLYSFEGRVDLQGTTGFMGLQTTHMLRTCAYTLWSEDRMSGYIGARFLLPRSKNPIPALRQTTFHRNRIKL